MITHAFTLHGARGGVAGQRTEQRRAQGVHVRRRASAMLFEPAR